MSDLLNSSSRIGEKKGGSLHSGIAKPFPYLAVLNLAQLQAVEQGIGTGAAIDSPPLLVIAGAGTGKTKTLAYRVAHLVVNGVNPRRILLLTFTRQAALEMTGRAKRITEKALGVGRLDLSYSGTFHAIGA